MNVLMFGWEFPPYNEGGLGTACYGLTKGLSNIGVNITLVLPHKSNASHIKIISLDNVKKIYVDSALVPYISSTEYSRTGLSSIYGKNLFLEVERYAKQAAEIAKKEKFDVIHAHDWLTYKAGMTAKNISKKPLVVHVHATEFDRTGGNGINEHVYNIEKQGMQSADKIIAVSNYTKNKIMANYGIDSKKIEVVHNAIDTDCGGKCNGKHDGKHGKTSKTVLFLGRVTLQKGPDYFVEAAKRVLEHDANVRFIIAGSGDMEPRIIDRIAQLGIGDKVLFTGFLRGDEVAQAYALADVYVMPSVSEPFGITPLEAMSQGTPCIISKQSGVSEIVKHCIKVDFWDIEELANSIIALLNYKELNSCMSQNAFNELGSISWDKQAQKCIKVYQEVLQW